MSRNVTLIFPETGTPVAGATEGKGVKKRLAIVPPLGLLYLGRVLLDAGYGVEVVDFNAEGYTPERLAESVRNADVVGISMQSFNREEARQTIADIRALGRDLPIVVGGPDLILYPRPVEGADLSVITEAEGIIVRIVEALIERRDLSTCPGTVFRDRRTGGIRRGPPLEVERDLDRIEFPARSLVRSQEKARRYNILGERMGSKVTTMVTSRGCPFSCSFCAHGAVTFQTYRERSAENVLAEIRSIYRDGYEILGIVDDNFTVNKRRVHRIMDGIIEEGIDLAMAVQGRVDAVDEELYGKMQRAGVRAVVFGLESANQRVLDFYKKRTTVEMNRRAVEIANRVGMYTVGDFIIGAPFEGADEIERTVAFAREIPLDFATFWVLDYAYGSALWEDAHRRGLIAQDEGNVTAGSERGLARFTSGELEQMALRAFESYYRRPQFWLRELAKLLRVKDRYFFRILGLASLRLVQGIWD
jgi:anaerobic magnesium-protoporphyrin IX monomethyl ester cyclase